MSTKLSNDLTSSNIAMTKISVFFDWPSYMHMNMYKKKTRVGHKELLGKNLQRKILWNLLLKNRLARKTVNCVEVSLVRVNQKFV